MAEGMGVPYLTGWVSLDTSRAEKSLNELDGRLLAVTKSIQNLSRQKIGSLIGAGGVQNSSAMGQNYSKSVRDAENLLKKIDSERLTRAKNVLQEVDALERATLLKRIRDNEKKEIAEIKSIQKAQMARSRELLNEEKANAKKLANEEKTTARRLANEEKLNARRLANEEKLQNRITANNARQYNDKMRTLDRLWKQEMDRQKRQYIEAEKAKPKSFWDTGFGGTVASIGKMMIHMIAFQAISNTIFAAWYKFWQIMREGVQLFLEMDKGVGRAMRTGLSPDEIKGYFGQGTKSIESSQGLGLGGAVAGNRKYVDTIREITTLQGLMFTSEHISSVKEYTEALYQLTSANIKMGSALQIIDDVMKVTIAAEGNITEVTKTLAGMYNIYKDTITDVTTEQQKFRSIANVVLYTWAKEQMELNDLNYSLKYVASSARAMGIDYKTLIATIGHLHTQMLRASTAGTGLRQVFNATGQNATKLSGLFLDLNTQMRLFGMENAKKHMGAFDPSKPMDMVKAVGSVRDQLLELRKAEGRGKDDPFSLGELQKVIKNFSVRGSNVMLTLLNSYDSWKQKIQEVKDLHGDYIDQFVKLQELNLQDQMAILAKNIRSIPGAFLLGLENTKDMATALANINAHFKDVIITAYTFGKMAKDTWQSWAEGLSNIGNNLIDITAKTVLWVTWLKGAVNNMNELTQGNALYVVAKQFGYDNDKLKTGIAGKTLLEGFSGFYSGNSTGIDKEKEMANNMRKQLKEYYALLRKYSQNAPTDIPNLFNLGTDAINGTKEAVDDLNISFDISSKKFEDNLNKEIERVIQLNAKLDEQNTLRMTGAQIEDKIAKKSENWQKIKDAIIESVDKKTKSEGAKRADELTKGYQAYDQVTAMEENELSWEAMKSKSRMIYSGNKPITVTNSFIIASLNEEIAKREELIKVKKKEIEQSRNNWKDFGKGAQAKVEIDRLQGAIKSHEDYKKSLEEYLKTKQVVEKYEKAGKTPSDIKGLAKKFGVETETIVPSYGGSPSETITRSTDEVMQEIKIANEKIGKQVEFEGKAFADKLKNKQINILESVVGRKEEIKRQAEEYANFFRENYSKIITDLEQSLDFPGLSGDEKEVRTLEIKFETNLKQIQETIQSFKDAMSASEMSDKTEGQKAKDRAVFEDNIARLTKIEKDYTEKGEEEKFQLKQNLAKKYADLSISDEQKRLDAIRDKYKKYLDSSKGDLANHHKVIKAMEEELAQEKFKIEEELQKKIRDARQKTFDIDKQRADESFQLEATKARKAFESEWLKKFQDAKDRGASPAELQRLAKDYEASKSELENKLSKAQSEFARQMGFQETKNLTDKMADVQSDIDRLYQEYNRSKDKDYKKQVMDEINNKKRELEELKNAIIAEANKMIGTEVEDTTRQIDDIIKKGTETDPEQRARNKKYEINAPGSNVKMILEKDGGGGSIGSTKGYVTGYADYYSKIDDINKKIYNQEITSLASLKNARDNRLNQLREELKLKQSIERQKFGTDVAMSGTSLNKAGGVWQTLSHAIANLTPQIMPKNIYDDPILKGLDRRINLKAQKQDTNINITVDGKKTTAGNATKIKEYAMGIMDEAVYSAMRGV